MPYSLDMSETRYNVSFYPTNHANHSMDYAESFLDTCNAEGLAPVWAINQIFHEHGSDFEEYIKQAGSRNWDSGEKILCWLGY